VFPPSGKVVPNITSQLTPEVPYFSVCKVLDCPILYGLIRGGERGDFLWKHLRVPCDPRNKQTPTNVGALWVFGKVDFPSFFNGMGSVCGLKGGCISSVTLRVVILMMKIVILMIV